MRAWLVVVLAALVLASGLSTTAQYQPVQGPDWSGFTQRTELAEAGDLAGAVRVSRFVQVSDAHILDDDAPYPMRQEPLDSLGSPFTSAQRPHEEHTDEVLDSMIGVINAIHVQDRLDFVMNTGDNIDNELENELMRFIDNWEGRYTEAGPVTGYACLPDGQSQGVEDDSQDVTDQCTSLPESFRSNNTALAPGLPWLSAFGNHDGLIQGNVPPEPSFDEAAAEYGRYFLRQHEYVGMHFDAGAGCVAGMPAGQAADDFGHGYGFAGDRLCDPDPDNDGYYAFDHRGIRFLVLDTVNDDFVTGNEELAGQFNPQQNLGYDVLGGYAEGSVDPVQHAWLLDEIESNPDRLIVLFSHHTVNSMFTERDREYCSEEPCLGTALREAGYVTGRQLIEEMNEHPNVVAWIGGHTHKHRIEPKAVEGAPSAGFWNVESSSLIDLPQQARTIELWRTADGAKGFLAMTRVDHAFDLSREIAQTDSQQKEDAAGDADDQDVILWFDIPPGVVLEPQPSLPRFLIVELVAPREHNGTHGRVGENVTVEFRVEDNLFDAAVGGLEARITIRHADPSGETAVKRLVQDASMHETATGHYAYTFTPDTGAVHFLDVTVSDPTGTYGGTGALESITIAGEDEPERKKDSPAWAVAPILLALLVFARRLR